MIHTQRILTLTSAAALSLALGQATAQTEPAVPPASAPPAAAAAPAPAPAAETAPAAAAPAAAPAAPAGADAMREQMEKRHAEAMAERNKRYAELRKHAAEVGLELPETPPWEQADMPDMPEGMPAGMMPRPAQMTDEERNAMREKRWEAMRARAAERGMELPETPPWEAAEQRRKEMQERFEQYRATIDAMSEEQKEAIKAIFGASRAPMERPVMPHYGMPCGQYGADCPQGYGPGMAPYMGPGMDPSMGRGMPSMGPGVGPGMGPGMMREAPPQPEPPAPAASAPPAN